MSALMILAAAIWFALSTMHHLSGDEHRCLCWLLTAIFFALIAIWMQMRTAKDK